jgi:hypothetical protein
MLRFFRKPPAYADEAFAGLSVLFCQDLRDPIYQHEILDSLKLSLPL